MLPELDSPDYTPPTQTLGNAARVVARLCLIAALCLSSAGCMFPLMMLAPAIIPAVMLGGVAAVGVATFERMHEIASKERKERRAEKRSISGTIKKASVETKTVEYDHSIHEMRDGHMQERVEKRTREEEFFRIVFADGRQKDFDAVCDHELLPGRRYAIAYNGLGEIEDVQPLENEPENVDQ